MGTAHVEAHRDMIDKLAQPPLCVAVRIIKHGDFDERGIAILLVSSPLLPLGYHGQQEAVIEGGRLRFKKWCDT